MESILTSIKKLLGIDEAYEQFDTDIIIHINSALFELEQMGVGKDGYLIYSKDDIWSDFIDDGYEAVKTLVYLKVKFVFDPPTGSLLEAMKEQISKLEWRLYVKSGQY